MELEKIIQISTRVSKEILKKLEYLEKKEKMDRSTLLRKLISIGLKEYSTELALNSYFKGEVTAWKAAELAGLSLYEFIDLLKARRIPAQYTLADLEEDLRNVKK